MTWLATMGAAPRYSYGPDHQSGTSDWHYPVVILAALLLGFVGPTHALRAGLLLALPGLVLAPWS